MSNHFCEEMQRVVAACPEARLRMHGSRACQATYPQIWVGNRKIGEGHADDWSGRSAWRDAAKNIAAEA